MMHSITLANRACRICAHRSGGPIVFWGISDRDAAELDRLVEQIDKLLPSELPYTLFTYQSTDWNTDFSPWATCMDRDRTFSGGGHALLGWLEGTALPYVKETYPTASAHYLAGYSLAGLFSLWAFYESQQFEGAACCSGSLWFDGWDGYADAKQAPEGSAVYLSLGGKESNTRDPQMATIGEQYRKQAQRCRTDANIRKFVYELNRGGHFADPTGRMAKGIAWLVRSN